MPKASQLGRNLHHSSVKKPIPDVPDEDKNDSPDVAALEVEAPILITKSGHLTKKEKLQEKRATFLQKFDPSGQSFSKSHERRMKRKARDQLAGKTLNDLSTAIAAMENDAVMIEKDQTIAQAQSETKSHQRPHKKAGVIGEGKSVPLSKAQRKRTVELERLRHPLILQNPEFTANPFQTIRTHAQNTLVKHTPS